MGRIQPRKTQITGIQAGRTQEERIQAGRSPVWEDAPGLYSVQADYQIRAGILSATLGGSLSPSMLGSPRS